MKKQLEIDNNRKPMSQYSILSPSSSKLHSPRPLERKPTQKYKFEKRKKEQPSEQFCYISPKRQEKEQEVCSIKLIKTPLSSQFTCDNFDNQQDYKNKFQSPADRFSRVELKQIKLNQQYNSSQDKQNKEIDKILKQFKDLNDTYKKKINDLTKQNHKLQIQISQLIQQKDQINKQLKYTKKILENKQKTLQFFNQEKYNYQKNLEKQRKNIKIKQQLNKHYQDIISKLNNSIQEIMRKDQQKTKYITNKDIDEILKQCHNKLEEKQQIISTLRSTIKYYQIEVTMLKKKRTELSVQRQAIEKIKGQNKKLQARVHHLSRGWERSMKQSSKSDFSLSFQLSPQKD